MKSAAMPRKESPCLQPSCGEILEKHKKYESRYGKNEFYWGLGVECESYLEISKPVLVKPGFMINNHTRERYSVDYYTSYKKEPLKKVLSQFEYVKENIPLPLLVNSHMLTKTDTNFEHQTLFKTGTPPNPKFNGKTIFDVLKEKCPDYFQGEHEKTFIFDGDSIEIMTQEFYKTTVDKTLEELTQSRKKFLETLQSVFKEYPELSKYGDIKWTSGNHGFAVMASNQQNLAIFNNGTYHINITLPTYLNEAGKIDDWPKFEELHKQYIQYIQWMEPLLVGNFGSPDPLAWISQGLYSLGSQRGAMSRYIGLGTYDTNTMARGKILTVDLSGVPSTWYKQYHKNSGYIALEKVGVDINFNKHWNHGVEIRFFDWFPEERLRGLLKFLVYLGDLAMTAPCRENPVKSHVWNQWMMRVIQKGNEAGCKKEEASVLSNILGFPCKPCENLEHLFADIYNTFMKQYQNHGPCSKYFFEGVKRPVKNVEVSPAVPVVEPLPTGWRCCQGFFVKQEK